MSGSGGGIDRPRNGPDCANLQETTNLNSVDAGVAATIKPNDQLAVSAQTPRGPLLAVTTRGEAVGSITSASLARILECINQGFHFVAIVQSITGGRIVVEVRPE